MKEIKVEVTKYQAEDGEIFDSPEQALHHERIKNGTRRVCHVCDGRQRVPSEDFMYSVKCPTCDGKGWVEKVEVWK